MCFIQKEVRRCWLGLCVVSSKNGKWYVVYVSRIVREKTEYRIKELGVGRLQVASY